VPVPLHPDDLERPPARSIIEQIGVNEEGFLKVL
jgi:hypothetical protein